MSYTHESVLAILQTRSEVIDWASKEERIKLICDMAVAQTAGEDVVMKHEGTEFDFVNGMLKMPIECIRLLRVRTLENKRIRWKKMNQLDAQILDYTAGTVKVDWWGLPVENGSLPISHFQLDYCADSCEFWLMRDAWLKSEISRIDMETMRATMNLSRKRATAKRVSVDEMEAAIWMMRNGIRFPNADVLKTN